MIKKNKHHTLYSYRRCPYAMRARMALVSAGIQCDVHEIDFKDKPAHMLEISPKGTVPVLQTEDGQVIEESLDIMLWALSQNDPGNWLENKDAALQLIAENDGPFKAALDRYKYPGRFEGEDCSGARDAGEAFLNKINEMISKEGQIFGAKATLADISIFPFIRQFAHVDKAWFDALPLKPLQDWLSGHLESDLFARIFKKQEQTLYALIS